MESPFHEGRILLLNKPFGWTSFDLVNKVRITIERHYKLKRMSLKVGHAGTLDPLATGLMIICTGKMTRKINELQGLEKEYTGTFFLGASSPSFDQETIADQQYPVAHITEAMIIEKASGFIGVQEQIPPVFSAKQVEGKRAYEYARKGKDIELKSNRIEISSFEITRTMLPEVDFRVLCSKGTYIRSLARDFGESLGSGAMLSRLVRTRIGQYRLEQASSSAEGLQFLTDETISNTGKIKFHPVIELSQ